MKKGFTLIELLVVISIIGMLSSITLSSLQSARGKANDAKVKETFHQMKVQAAVLYEQYENNGSGMCGSTIMTKLYIPLTNGTCLGDSGGWAIYGELKNPAPGKTKWCINSTGAAMASNMICGITYAGLCGPII